MKFLFLSSIFSLIALINISCGFVGYEEPNYKWKLTFEDNFDTFDSTKWITRFNNGNRTIWSNKELQWYKDENVSVANGILKIKAKRESVYGKDPENEKQFEYTSGMICNSISHMQAYGKWEMKVKFPFKKGIWPAFFIIPTQQPSLPEIDVFEYFGIEKDKISTNHHWGLDYPNYPGGQYEGKSAPFYNTSSKEITGDFSDVWMIWSFECLPDIMIWKLNGKEIYSSSKGIPTAPLYMIANVAIKDWDIVGFKVDKLDQPFEMQIDYVRIYKMVP